MTKLNHDNVPCTWCIRAVPISVFSRGDNCGISKGMEITRTAYSRVNKITQLYHVFIQRLLCVSNIRPRWVCCAKKVFMFLDSLLKLLGYREHCVYSKRVCYCPNLYSSNKWYAYARNYIGPSFFRQNVYIQRYIFGQKCIFKTKGLSAHRTQIFTECTTPYRGMTSWAWRDVS